MGFESDNSICSFILGLPERTRSVCLAILSSPDLTPTYLIRLHRFASGAPMVVRRGNRTSQVSRSDRRWHRPIRQQGIIVSLPNAAFTRYVSQIRDTFVRRSHILRLSVLSSVITLSWFWLHISWNTHQSIPVDKPPLIFGGLCLACSVSCT